MDYTMESGSSVSHYRIISAIGAGGMGQVYKAQDLTLERTVALKILPPELVRNDERVRRFMQEAKSASSLNHPNIVTIHEIGQSGGTSDSIHYIAMELIDGATLKRKIHDGVTDLRTLLGYFAQAAEGLSKAHAAGIVHRDLKPENIMVTRDGFSKVLDFGLAKLSVKKSAADGSMATDIQAGTREGTVLGTVSYMSPEQVRGEIVDHRSDIFSFGCVLYEAATRRRPFEGQSDVDVMHSILHDKPVPVDELNPQVPAEVRRIIRRCLAKDPERRYQSMKDLALELSDVVDEFEQLSMSAASRTSGSISQPIPAHPRPRNTAVLAIIAAVLLVVSALAFWWTRGARTVKAAAPGIAYGSMKIHQVTTSNNVRGATISPDGKYRALVTAERGGTMALSVLQVATNASVQIVPPTRSVMSGLLFTPDSNYLTFSKSEGESVNGYSILYQVPSLGGTPQRLVFDVDTHVSYSPDGQRMAFGRGHPDLGENWLMVANADGSGERKLATAKRLIGISAPAWSPDGRTILFDRPGATTAGSDLVGVDVATGAQRVIGKTWAEIDTFRWLPDGKSIVLSAGADIGSRDQIWMQPYPDGEAVHITNDVNTYDALSTTADGSTLAVVRRESDADVLQLNAGDAPPAPILPHSSNHYFFPLAAARGGVVATTVFNESGANIGIMRPGAEQPAMLTREGKSLSPSITPDGKTIVFFSLRNGNVPHIFIAETDTGVTRQLTKGAGEVFPTISPDGSFVIYTTVDGHIQRIGVAGGAAVTLATPGTILHSDISPDGKEILYGGWSSSSGRAEPRLFFADASSGKTLKDIPWHLQEAVWAPSGDALIAVDRPAGVGNMVRIPLNGAPPVPLTKYSDGTIEAFGVSPEGTVYIVRGKPRSDVVTIRDFR